MKWKTLIPFGVALVLAVLAVQLGKGVLQKLAGGGGRAVKVVVAAKEFEPGYQIKEADVALASMPSASVPQGALLNVADAVNRVVAIPVVKGQTLVKAALTPEGAGTGLQALVPPGMRAVTMEVNEFSGVGGLLFPGCHVDIITTMLDDATKAPVAKPIVQNARVTAVGQKMSQKPGTAGKEVVSAPVKSVTMIMTSKEALALDLASSKSRPRLVLRGAADEGPAAVGRVTLAELIAESSFEFQPAPDTGTAPATQPVDPFGPAKSAGMKHPFAVQVINGGTVTEFTFEYAGH